MKSNVLGGILLICGTSVGTGILGIPSITAESGFGLSCLLFVCCWLFSTLAALFYMEVHLWQPSPTANLLSMTQLYFGPKAKTLIWIIYLALLYSLMCTYLLAGSSWIVQSISELTQISVNHFSGMIVFILLIGLFIFFGIRMVDRVNRGMLIGLALSYFFILFITLPSVKPALLLHTNPALSPMLKSLPLLITAFGYSIIVPSLSTYLKRNALDIQKTILWGSLITLVIYLLWEIITLGNIPLLGAHGLRVIASSLDNGTEVANALIRASQNSHLPSVLTVFALFAVITSFLGVSMALYHTLADGLELPTQGRSGGLLLILTYVPPILFLRIIPSGFNQILSWAGVLVAFLMGVLPMLMIIKGRYRLKLSGHRVPGGLALILVVLLFFIAVICCEWC